MNRPPTYKHHIEIMPASLMPRKGDWQGISQNMPIGGCLLVAGMNNPKQAKIMRKLTHLFRQHGKQVVIWISDDQS